MEVDLYVCLRLFCCGFCVVLVGELYDVDVNLVVVDCFCEIGEKVFWGFVC